MGKLQIHRSKASITTPFQPVARPFAPASAVQRTVQKGDNVMPLRLA